MKVALIILRNTPNSMFKHLNRLCSVVRNVLFYWQVRDLKYVKWKVSSSSRLLKNKIQGKYKYKISSLNWIQSRIDSNQRKLTLMKSFYKAKAN
jgi:hypothetical protein